MKFAFFPGCVLKGAAAEVYTSMTKVCKALGIDTATENPATVKVLPVANDGDANNITLAMDANQQVETGVAVKFAVKKDNVQVGELFNSNAIKIPLSSGTGVYTVAPADVVTAQ